MSTNPRPSLTSSIWAIRAVFAVLGINSAIMAPLIPAIKLRFGVSEDALGILLLMVGIGSVSTMPLTGVVCRKRGSIPVILFSGVMLAGLTVGATVLPFFWMLFPWFFVLGAMMGALDISMNLNGLALEKSAERSLMSGFHGFYSLGGLVGSGGLYLLMRGGLTISGVVFVIATMSILTLGFARTRLLSEKVHESEHKSPRILSKLLLVTGVLCGITFAAEGSVSDWSGLVLLTRTKAPSETLGLGYGLFAASMTLGRLTGDWIRSHLGDFWSATGGAAVCAIGFLLAASSREFSLVLLGFGLVGLGASNIVPILFSLSSRLKGISSESGVATVTTMGYAGFLLAPPMLGLVAARSSLSAAMLLVSISMVTVAAIVPVVMAKSREG